MADVLKIKPSPVKIYSKAEFLLESKHFPSLSCMCGLVFFMLSFIFEALNKTANVGKWSKTLFIWVWIHHRGSVKFKWIKLYSTAIWFSYTPCTSYLLNQPWRIWRFHVEVSKEQIHLMLMCWILTVNL